MTHISEWFKRRSVVDRCPSSVDGLPSWAWLIGYGLVNVVLLVFLVEVVLWSAR